MPGILSLAKMLSTLDVPPLLKKLSVLDVLSLFKTLSKPVILSLAKSFESQGQSSAAVVVVRVVVISAFCRFLISLMRTKYRCCDLGRWSLLLLMINQNQNDACRI